MTLRCLLATVLSLVPSIASAQEELTYEVKNVYSTIFDRSDPNPLLWDVNGTDGLAWDGSGIWLSACDTMTLLKMDPLTGEQMDVFYLPDMDDMTDHLAWDGQYLWGNIHSMRGDPQPWQGRLVQIDVEAREIVKTIEVPFRDANSMTPMGMGFHGGYLWTQDPRYGEVYRIDPETEEGKDEPFFYPPIFQGEPIMPCGVHSDGYSCLWISDLNNGVFFQVTADTGDIVSYLVPPDNPDPDLFGAFRPPDVTKLFTGMTTDGERVWIVDEMEGNPLLYEIEVDFPTRGPCAHPVADGEGCVPDGQPFCSPQSLCYAARCVARCDLPDSEPCAEGFVCGDGDGFAVCTEPLAEGAACSSDGLACAEGLVCWAPQHEQTRCQSTCETDDECDEGFACGSPEGDPVCVAAPDGGAACDGGSCTPPDDEPDGGGCGCQAAGSSATFGWVFVLTLATGLLRRKVVP